MINSWIEISAVLLCTWIFIFLPVICVVGDFALWTLGRYCRGTILRCPFPPRARTSPKDAT